MPIIYHEVYRPAETPSANLPFGVRSTGHYKIRPPYTSGDNPIDFLQFFWCVRGSGIIEFDRTKRTINHNQIAVYYPNARHFFYADRDCWKFYWFTMDGSFAASLPAAFGLEAGVYDAGPAPVELFHKLRRLVCKPSKQSELQACVTAFAILARAAGSHEVQTDELVARAVERMNQQYAAPDMNIKTLCASLGVRRVAFFKRFHAAMGMTPGDYAERLRIQNALSLLKHSHLSIAAVAAQCGYKDANYFSRVIRRVTGQAPRQLRERVSIKKTD